MRLFEFATLTNPTILKLAKCFDHQISRQVYDNVVVKMYDNPNLTILVDEFDGEDLRDLIKEFIYQNEVRLYNLIAPHSKFINKNGEFSPVGSHYGIEKRF